MVGREGLAPPKPKAGDLQSPVIAAIRPPHIKMTLSQSAAYPFNLPHLLSEVERDAGIEPAIMEHLRRPTRRAYNLFRQSRIWCQNLGSIQAFNAYEASMGADPSGIYSRCYSVTLTFPQCSLSFRGSSLSLPTKMPALIRFSRWRYWIPAASPRNLFFVLGIEWKWGSNPSYAKFSTQNSAV